MWGDFLQQWRCGWSCGDCGIMVGLDWIRSVWRISLVRYGMLSGLETTRTVPVRYAVWKCSLKKVQYTVIRPQLGAPFWWQNAFFHLTGLVLPYGLARGACFSNLPYKHGMLSLGGSETVKFVARHTQNCDLLQINLGRLGPYLYYLKWRGLDRFEGLNDSAAWQLLNCSESQFWVCLATNFTVSDPPRDTVILWYRYLPWLVRCCIYYDRCF